MPKYVYAFYARINPNNVSRNIIIEMHLFFEILGRNSGTKNISFYFMKMSP